MPTETAAKVRHAVRKQLILEALEEGPHTSAELAAEVDISQRAARKFLRELRDEGRVTTDGTAEPAGGLPPTLYKLAESEAVEESG